MQQKAPQQKKHTHTHQKNNKKKNSPATEPPSLLPEGPLVPDRRDCGAQPETGLEAQKTQGCNDLTIVSTTSLNKDLLRKFLLQKGQIILSYQYPHDFVSLLDVVFGEEFSLLFLDVCCFLSTSSDFLGCKFYFVYFCRLFAAVVESSEIRDEFLV